MTQRITLLVNPTAGGRPAVTATRLLRLLRDRGGEVTVVAGRSQDEGTQLAREVADFGTDVLVAVGGDGVVHTALAGVVGTEVPLAAIPAGTGNDIARAFPLPRSLPAAAEAIMGGRFVVADTVGVAGRHFLSVLACGVDSRVNERVNGMRLPVGRSGYLLGLLAELRTFTPVRFVIEVDGEPLAAEGMCVAVGNTSTYGGGMRVCPAAAYDDGLLEVVLVHAMPTSTFLRLFPRVYTGTHTELGSASVTVLRGRRITIATTGVGATPVVGHADGEPIAEPPLTCEVIPRSVRMLTAAAPSRTS